ncbi:Plasmodium exported protein (Pm-fam-a like), unknown function [Plasmodium malariae]|uniref:Fam-l protein n=1 Tax=Plasmodium malariae TaxID=5858 RepID=A0A1A8XAZ7_PLAMA|nr:Plasmodium exported protein (Pm-fam-a like), unknown function [Plasmodium malariae]
MVKYKRDKVSTTVCLKEEIQNELHDKKDITNNEKWDEDKKKQSSGSSSMSTRGHKKNEKNKSCIFETKKYSNLEKKIFKELDYVDFLRNNKTISDNIYKKIMRKKCSLRIVLPLLLLLFLLISLILDLSNSFGLVKGLCKILNLYASTNWYSSLHLFLKKSPLNWLFKSGDKLKYKVSDAANNVNFVQDYTYVYQFFDFLIYVIPFIILGVTIILGVIYYHNKVKKYEKIKFRKRYNE